METKSTTISINAEYIAVPTDFLEARDFYITSTNPDTPLLYKTSDQITFDYTATGTPGYYCVIGSNFRFGPAPDTTYTATLNYYAKPLTLAVTTQETNSLYPANADLYLFATLLQASGLLVDDARIPMWKSAYEDAVAKINKAAARARWGGNQMSTRPG